MAWTCPAADFLPPKPMMFSFRKLMRSSRDKNDQSHEPPLATQRNWRSRKEQILQTLEPVLQRPVAQKIAKKILENISQMEGLPKSSP
jgi:hypothetical protein